MITFEEYTAAVELIKVKSSLCFTRDKSTKVVSEYYMKVEEVNQHSWAQPAIAYYTARLLNDEIPDPKTNNNKKGARL